MNRQPYLCWIPILLALAAARPATAYPVAPAVSLDELAGQADLVCKVEVVGTRPVEDAWFEKAHGFAPHATEMKVIAIYQGKCPFERIFFHHYAPGGPGRAPGYAPQA